MPLDTRRVVLLVPTSGLSLLREFTAPEVYLALSGTQASFDNHYVSVHMAFVRVRRGGSKVGDDGSGWRSLSKHLSVRDTREDDPDAELMVSTIIPTFALTLAPLSLTQLQLRPCESVRTEQASEDVLRRLGGVFQMVFYGADLANKDRAAILTPDGPSGPSKGCPSTSSLSCPKTAVSSRREEDTPLSAGTGWSGAPEPPFFQRSMNGVSVIDQSLELKTQPGHGRDAPLAGRVTLVMVNAEAHARLAGKGVPHVKAARDPCSVRVILGEDLVHVARFPFPVRSKDVRVVYSKSRGYAHFTVLPLEGLLEVPFALTACNVEKNDPRTLLSTFCWPMCVPLASLPRLDFNAEWARNAVSTDRACCCAGMFRAIFNTLISCR